MDQEESQQKLAWSAPLLVSEEDVISATASTKPNCSDADSEEYLGS